MKNKLNINKMRKSWPRNGVLTIFHRLIIFHCCQILKTLSMNANVYIKIHKERHYTLTNNFS